MADITFSQLPTVYDPLSVTLGPLSFHRSYFGVSTYAGFNSDGTLSAVHVQTITDAAGNAVPTIISWAQFSGIDAIQQATVSLPFAPLKAMLDAGTATGANVMGYLLSGNDAITGSAGRDILQGLGGADTIHGNGGSDVLQGGDGADWLWGDAGADVISGGAGADVLIGGAGADVFQFKSVSEGVDHIKDFAHGVDHIAISATAFGIGHLTAGVNFMSGYIPAGNGPTLEYVARSGQLYFDADGSGAGAAVQIAVLDNHMTLTASDFLFI